jgi:hypothetical protein
VAAAAPLPAAPPAGPGALARALLAVWDFTLTLLVMALFVGAWGVAGQGVMDAEPLLLYGGIALSVLFTPAAVHRLTGRRGRYGVGVLGAAAATGAAAYYVGSGDDPLFLVTAAFGLQVVTCLALARLTHRAPAPDPLPAA